MKVFTTAAVTLAVIAAAGAGAALSPAPKAQVRARSSVSTPRIVQVFAGGSQIGVSVRDIDPEEAKRLKLPNVSGVLVEDVRQDSPAQKAGIKDGDVIVEFDGERVRSTRQFTRLVQETPADRQVPSVVVRDGQRITLSVEPEASDAPRAFRELERYRDLPVPPVPPAPPARPAPAPDAFEVFPHFERFFGGSGRLGITVDSLSDQLAEYFGAKSGVLVTSVNNDSAASKAGLKAGDVITALNGGTVDSPSSLSRRTQRLEDGDEFTLDIVRDRKTMTLKGKVERQQSRRWTARSII